MPIVSLAKGMSVPSCLKELERTQWESKEHLTELQTIRLRALLDHAYRNVPYYRKVFDRTGIDPGTIRGAEDLGKLPILNKEDVREHLDELVALNYPRRNLQPMSTSGSTGQPLRFYHDWRANSYIYAANLRNRAWARLYLGDKHVRFRNPTFDSRLRTVFYEGVQRIALRCESIPSFGITQDTLLRYVNQIREYRPKAMIGDPAGLHLLAGFIREHDIKDLEVGTIISASEQLWKRELIERAFHGEVFDNYSSREFAIASECEMHTGFHISSEIILLEIVKDRGTVSVGERGEILVTDLTNYGMPFIRYRIGDLGAMTDESCPCGRGLPILKTVEGRSSDYIVTNEGQTLLGGNLTLLFKNVPVIDFQVHQKTRTKVTVHVVPAPEYSSDDSQNIVHGMKRLLGQNTDVELITHKPLTRLATRKHRFIISDINSKGFN